MENARPLFKGKNTVINILAEGCLWYPAYVYHKKKNLMTRYGLFSGEKKDPVKSDIVDLEKKSQAIKMSWIAKLFDKNCPGKFKYTMIEILNQYKQVYLGKSVF